MSQHTDFKKEYQTSIGKIMVKYFALLFGAMILAFSSIYLLVWLITGTPMKIFDDGGSAGEAKSVSGDDLVGPGYAVETRYIGGIGYPEVYEVPFKQTSFYTSNKVLWERIPDVMPAIADSATGFMDKLLNSSYRTIAENKQAYIHDVLPYLSTDYPYNEIETQAYSETAEEFVGNYADYVVDNEISMEAKFLTDTSLIYEDAYTYVRGVVEYTVFSSKDEKFPVSNEKQAMMVEVVMMRDGLDPSSYKVVDWYQIDMPETE